MNMHVSSPVTVELELADIQGILLFGYSKLTEAAFCLLAVEDAAKARAWLGSLRVRTASVEDAGQARAVNVALSAPGLRALDLDPRVLETFPVEFQEGMVTESRQRVLGDYGASDPKNWHWGGPGTPAVHVLLMLYATPGGLAELVAEARTAWEAGGLREVAHLGTEWLPGNKEHFGFDDGISDVPIRGHRGRTDGVSPGEFLLGYPNEYGKYTASPHVPDAAGAQASVRQLEPARDLAQARDLGRNGSYLVFRQLHQDVHGFWKWLDERAAGVPAERVRIASKMVGRWPNGSSLVQHPHGPGPTGKPDNDFFYVADDVLGQKCPLGAHIRRTHPRDALGPLTPGDERLANLHRILRRGRVYGEALAPELRPEGFLERGDDGAERGLHFICFNANIDRQFEFVQQTWTNSAKFAGLRNDPDPLIGVRDPAGSDFTIQKEGIRERHTGLPEFVVTRGGGYFFLPGLAALRYLASA